MTLSLDATRLAIGVLLSNRIRTILSTVGVAVGVAALIAMIAIGRGSADQVQMHIKTLGGDVLTVQPGQARRAGGGARSEAAPFDQSDHDAISSNVIGLKQLAPMSSEMFPALASGKSWTARFVGTNSQYFTLKRWRLRSGRMFSTQEIERGANVCLLGAKASAQLFDGRTALGSTIRVKQMPCLIIGLLEQRGQTAAGEDENNLVAMPILAFQRRLLGRPDVHTFIVSAQPGVSLSRLSRRIENLLRERRAIAAGQDSDFSIIDMRDVARAMTGTSQTLSMMIGLLAAVCFIVGGIGIMNVMLVSLNERTREIGVRLAVGALPWQVKTQFLFEAVILSLAGGIVGVVGGLATIAFVANVFATPVAIDSLTILLAVGTACAIGLVFGYLPAARASRLDPVEALRLQ